MLTLREELLLLSLHDEKGSVASSGSMALPFALAGAVVMELQRNGRIDVDKKRLVLADAAPTGDEMLDQAMENIGGSAKVRAPKYWISRPDRLVPSLRDRLLESLVEKNILQREEHRFLWLIPFDRYPEMDGRAEDDIRRRLRNVILEDVEPDERTALLLCLVHACDLAGEVFPKEELKKAKTKLKKFAERDQIAKAVSDQVAAVTMTLISAVISASTLAAMSTATAGR
jgi:Golgi phosphoprotein 3